VSERQKKATNEKRARRLGTGEGIRAEKPRGGGGVPMWTWVLAGAIVIAALVVGVVLATRSSGSSNSGSTATVVTDRLATNTIDFASQGTWPANYDNLSGAMAALQLPGQSDSVEHYHAHFTIYADGKKVVVPANMGLDTTNQVYSPIHTHDESGVIHIEADTKDFRGTLGDVFDVWGVKFDKQCLGGYCDGVKVWVNGKPNDQYGDLQLQSHDAVTIVAGDPPAGFKPDQSYKFPAGE
jgi:hypothetical protein